MKEYLKKKKEAYEAYKAKKDAQRQAQARIDEHQLKLDAIKAEAELKKLKQQEAQRETIRRTEEYRRATKPPSKIASHVRKVQESILEVQKAGSEVASMLPSSGGGKSQDLLGGIGGGKQQDIFAGFGGGSGNIFGSPPKKRKKKR